MSCARCGAEPANYECNGCGNAFCRPCARGHYPKCNPAQQSTPVTGSAPGFVGTVLATPCPEGHGAGISCTDICDNRTNKTVRMFCAARISAAHASEVVTLTKQRDHEAEQCDRYRKLASESASEVERLRELSGAQDRLLRSAVIERDEARSRLKAVTAERDEAWELLKVREDNEEHELARELAMARSQLQRAVGLLYEEAKNTLCIEAPAGGQLGQTYCAGDCWNCRVRAFLTSLPLPQEGAPSTPEGTRDDGIR